MNKIDITKPKRYWHRHKEQIVDAFVDALMITAASLIVLVMLVVLIVK